MSWLGYGLFLGGSPSYPIIIISIHEYRRRHDDPTMGITVSTQKAFFPFQADTFENNFGTGPLLATDADLDESLSYS